MSRLWPPAVSARWSPGSGNSVARPTQIQAAWKRSSSSQPNIPALVYAGAGRVRTRSLIASRHRHAARIGPRARLTQRAPAGSREAERGGGITQAETEHSLGVYLGILERDLDGEAVHHGSEADREIVDVDRL